MKLDVEMHYLMAIIISVFCTVQNSEAESNKSQKPQPVTVENSSSNPVPVNVQNPTTTVSIQNTASVKSVDNFALQPYARSGTATFTGAQGAQDPGPAIVSFDVPAGKRLVLELITVRALLPAGQQPNGWVQIAGQPFPWHFLTFTPQGSFFGADIYTVTQALHLSADAGSGAVSVAVRKNSIDNNAAGPNINTVGVTISGYLVDVP